MRLIDADVIDFNDVFVGGSEFAKDTRDAAQGLIDRQPTIEAEPVRRGRWIKIKGTYYSSSEGKSGLVKKCSLCGEPSPCGYGTPYCAICGAQMEGSADSHDN